MPGDGYLLGELVSELRNMRDDADHSVALLEALNLLVGAAPMKRGFQIAEDGATPGGILSTRRTIFDQHPLK